MKTDTLKAIINIKNLEKTDFNEIYPQNSEMINVNRIQNVGSALECFVKDAFSNSFEEIDKKETYRKYFSFLGSANFPPDSMLINGDAIEVKKANSINTEIQLNSSYPKSKLMVNDTMITSACKNCEEWFEKDMLYTFGTFINKTQLKTLLFVYGNCFAAEDIVYRTVRERITDSIESLPDSEVTKELGRINKVDPLGITKLRIRGMWLLENPFKIFSNIFNYGRHEQEFTLISLMLKEKFDSFSKESKDMISNDKDIIIKDVEIEDPNNPIKLLDAIMIRYDKK